MVLGAQNRVGQCVITRITLHPQVDILGSGCLIATVMLHEFRNGHGDFLSMDAIVAIAG